VLVLGDRDDHLTALGIAGIAALVSLKLPDE
jgi:hypothetical protein